MPLLQSMERRPWTLSARPHKPVGGVVGGNPTRTFFLSEHPHQGPGEPYIDGGGREQESCVERGTDAHEVAGLC